MNQGQICKDLKVCTPLFESVAETLKTIVGPIRKGPWRVSNAKWKKKLAIFELLPSLVDIFIGIVILYEEIYKA